MTCSKCAECCKWLAAEVNLTIADAKRFARNNPIIIGIDKQSEDMTDYFTYRNIKITDYKDQTYLVIPNPEPDRVRIEPIQRNRYSINLFERKNIK